MDLERRPQAPVVGSRLPGLAPLPPGLRQQEFGGSAPLPYISGMPLYGMQDASRQPPRPENYGQAQPAASGPSFRRPGSLSPSPRMPLGTERSQWSGWGGQA